MEFFEKLGMDLKPEAMLLIGEGEGLTGGAQDKILGRTVGTAQSIFEMVFVYNETSSE